MSDAGRLAAYVRDLAGFEMVDHPGVPHAHMGATIVDAVLQPAYRYSTTVAPRVKRVREQFPEVTSTSGFLALLLQQGGARVLDWKLPEELRRMVALAELLIGESVESEESLNRWLEERGEEHVRRLLAARGISPGTSGYLRVLAEGSIGQDVDGYMASFIGRAGVEVGGSDYVSSLVKAAAGELDVAPATLIHSIWLRMWEEVGAQTHAGVAAPGSHSTAEELDEDSVADDAESRELVVFEECSTSAKLTTDEGAALRRALGALSVEDEAIERASAIRDLDERLQVLRALLGRIDDGVFKAEKTAFGVTDHDDELRRARAFYVCTVGRKRSWLQALVDAAITGVARPEADGGDGVSAVLSHLEDETVVRPISELAEGADGADQPGLVAWLVDEHGAWLLAHELGGPFSIAPGLIHVAAAGSVEPGSGRTSGVTIGKMLNRDLRGPIRVSDVRATLAAVLHSHLRLQLVRPVVLSKESEQALTGWMAEHMRWSCYPCEDQERLFELFSRIRIGMGVSTLSVDVGRDLRLRHHLVELRRSLLQTEDSW